MHKKILAICAALVALAAVPAMAAASPALQENGVNLAAGAKITAKSTGNAIFVAGSTSVVCNNNDMSGTVKTNSGTLIEGTIESATFKGSESEERCDGGSLLGPTRVTIPGLKAGTSHWCIKSTKTADQFELVGANCGTASGTLTFVLEGLISCTYKRTSSVLGTFTTKEDPAKLTVTGEPEFTLEEGNFFCPSTGKITSMVFDLYTSDGTTAITIN